MRNQGVYSGPSERCLGRGWGRYLGRTMIDDLDAIQRGLTAAVCGVALGFPSRKRPGGVSTHVLVALGALIFTWIGRNEDEGDVLRVVAGVCQGVGFVGAAAVIRTPKYVVGITTAASIWIAGALGCVAALSVQPLRAVVFAGIVAILASVLRRFEHPRRGLVRSRRTQ